MARYVTAWREGHTYEGDIHSCWNDYSMFRDFVSSQVDDEDDVYYLELYEVEGYLVADEGGYDGWKVRVANRFFDVGLIVYIWSSTFTDN